MKGIAPPSLQFCNKVLTPFWRVRYKNRFTSSAKKIGSTGVRYPSKYNATRHPTF